MYPQVCYALLPICILAYFNVCRKKVADHQRAERERVAAAKEVERLKTEVAGAKTRRAELQRIVSLPSFQ